LLLKQASRRPCQTKLQKVVGFVRKLRETDNPIVKFVRMDMDVAKYIPDELDRRIIAHLRIDGRAFLAKLADAIGVARGIVQNRLERLSETGTLMGFTVREREDYDNRSVHAVMMIEVMRKSTTQVIRKLRGIAEIAPLHTTNGK
jgi:DNA-binding Lrp family transcriptional regulator